MFRALGLSSKKTRIPIVENRLILEACLENEYGIKLNKNACGFIAGGYVL